MFLFVTFYVTMAAAGLLVELLFGALGLIPTERNAQVVEASVTWNYTTVLNIVFLTLALVLVVRFLRTGGPAMLRAMSAAPVTGTNTVFVCPMHPEIRQDEPGTCPILRDAAGATLGVKASVRRRLASDGWTARTCFRHLPEDRGPSSWRSDTASSVRWATAAWVRCSPPRISTLERRVALKQLSPALVLDDAARKRFQREARALARINDPNVVGVFDTGEDAGRPFLVMEFVEGTTLRDELRRLGRIEPTRAASIGAGIAGGLAAAHAQGVVHRDVKPSNVFLTSSDVSKIGDFGIARVERGDATLTLTGQAFGSPPYVAPEQATGGRVDARADLYSLGCVLFHMLAGRQPFDGGDAVSIDVPARPYGSATRGCARSWDPGRYGHAGRRTLGEGPGRSTADG